MKKLSIIFITLLISASLFAEVSAADSKKAFGIMEAADNQLAYKGDYSCTVSLIIEKPGKPKENLQYKMFERIGKDVFTMVQLFPEADKGNGYLRDGDNIWAYDPIGRKFSHSSLKEALGDSDMKVDDMSKDDNKWRKNYKVSELKEETLGKYEVYAITLEAVTNVPSYEKSTYYIRKDVPLILKISDFSASGRLMRTVLIPKYTKTEKGYVGYHTILRDELNPGEQTQQIISELSFESLPDRIFTKAYLEGLN